jgi:hypothetical protein
MAVKQKLLVPISSLHLLPCSHGLCGYLGRDPGENYPNPRPAPYFLQSWALWAPGQEPRGENKPNPKPALYFLAVIGFVGCLRGSQLGNNPRKITPIKSNYSSRLSLPSNPRVRPISQNCIRRLRNPSLCDKVTRPRSLHTSSASLPPSRALGYRVSHPVHGGIAQFLRAKSLHFVVGVEDDRAPDVGHVGHEQGADFVGNGPQALVVPLAGVGRATRYYHLGPEVHGLLLQLIVVDVASLHNPTALATKGSVMPLIFFRNRCPHISFWKYCPFF